MTSPRAYRSNATDVGVRIADALVDEMSSIANDPDCETGGILVGRYTDSSLAEIELASPPPGDSEAGLDWFKRGENGLRELLEAEWSAATRRYYVGEWHFHPRGGGAPSKQDLEQMRDFAREDRYRCKRPVMIILYGTRRRRIRVFVLDVVGACVELRSADD